MKRTTKTLLLAAHGSSRPSGDNPVAVLAERLRALDIFADVRCGFLKGEPLLTDVLADIKTPELVVVPMLSGHGFITDSLIPDALAALNEGINVRLCEPIGSHPAIAEVMAQRAQSIITERNLKPETVSILITAHGNVGNPENARQSRNLAQRIEKLTGGVQAHAAFIEEEPLISSWPTLTMAENLIVLPFLIGGGLHEAEDVPVMLGLNADDPALQNFSDETPFIGPLVARGRKIWYCRTLGFEPAMSDLVLKLVRNE